MRAHQYPHLRVSGGAFECGVQYGRLSAPRVRLSVAAYKRVFELWAGLGWDAVRTHAREYISAIDVFNGAYLEEMRRIARGAELLYFLHE